MEAAICHQCYTSIGNQLPFCTECGTRQEDSKKVIKCGDCEGIIKKQDAFCTHCGQAQSEGEREEPVPSEDGQRPEQPAWEAEREQEAEVKKQENQPAIKLNFFYGLLSVLSILLYTAVFPAVFYIAYLEELNRFGAFAGIMEAAGGYLFNPEKEFLYMPTALGFFMYFGSILFILIRLAKKSTQALWKRALNHMWKYLLTGLAPLTFVYFFSEYNPRVDVEFLGYFSVAFPFLVSGVMFGALFPAKKHVGWSVVWFITGVILLGATGLVEIIYINDAIESFKENPVEGLF